MEINEIREAVQALPRARNGRLGRVPTELRAEIIRESKQCAGSLEEFAQGVGISYATLMGWERRQAERLAKGKATFRRVEVKDKVAEKHFTVEGARGLKVMNLKLSEVVALFREVGL
jgi:transposase-like protein